MHSDFEDAGVLDALRRLYKGVEGVCEEAPALPSWVICERLPGSTPCFESWRDSLHASASVETHASKLAVQLARVEALLCAMASKSRRHEAGALRAPMDSGARLSSVCLVRLLVGSCCELYAAVLSLKSNVRRPDADARRARLRLYCDSALAAVWTSAHAEYLVSIQTHGLSVTPPSLHAVPFDASEPDLSGLSARRLCPKACSSDAAVLLGLCTRCVSPGSRGLEAALKQALEKSEGTRRICTNTVVIALTGMHSCIHPSERLSWPDRHVLLRVLLPMVNHGSFVSIMERCPFAFRECVRRMFSRCSATAIATACAQSTTDRNVETLLACPIKLPSPGTEVGMTALANAGKEVLDTSRRGKTVDLCAEINEAFARLGSSWNPAYLGKGAAAQAAVTAVTTSAGDVFSSAFRCNFVPFWAHSNTHKLRVTRLDSVQFDAIHRMNAATTLTMLLSDEDRMRLNRLAIQNKCAGILSLDELAQELGATVPAAAPIRNAIDAASAMGACGARAAAKMLSFARMAAMTEDILIYDLGEATHARHARALVRRLLIEERYGSCEDATASLHLLPQHATTLVACIECKRVANAVFADSKSQHAFNELGTNGSMIAENAEDGAVTLRCAKRCSASLKTAMAFEEHMTALRIEEDEFKHDCVGELIGQGAAGGEAGAAARARRDSRNALEQRRSATPCGSDNMLCIPLVGRAVRLWSVWYSMCAYCGCFVRFQAHHRHGSDICCMKCDSRMLNRNSAPSTARDAAGSEAAQCRFCGKVRSDPPLPPLPSLPDALAVRSQLDPMRTGTRWRLVRAPQDTSGANATLPPPLRTVHFCPAHFRAWIPQAMKQLPTRVVLSHIVFNARPCFSQPAQSDKTEEKKPKPRDRGLKRKMSKIKS